MCCFIASLFMLGPRAAILIWWLIQPIRWNETFDTFLWPLVGFLVAPWTTLMYVAVFPGGINGFDYIWLGFGVVFDLFSWFGGGYTNRGRLPTGSTTA
jgi:succinate dehydrogenase/fumarate reductase cytochrome b subunit